MRSVHSGDDETTPLLSDLKEADRISDSHSKNAAVVSSPCLDNGEGGSEDLELTPDKGVLWRLVMAVVRRRRGGSSGAIGRPGEEGEAGIKREDGSVGTGRSKGNVSWVRATIGAFFFLASIYIITHIYQALQYVSLNLATITKNVTPIPCHSHNDYWRPSPLYSALRTGCTGIEADIWLFSNDLFVGHTTRALRREKTLSSMYIEPLTQILDLQNRHDHHRGSDTNPARHERKNGVYPLDSVQTVVLLIDFKNDGHAIFPIVSRQLAPLRRRGYLSYFNGSVTVQGPITVVVTGNAPFELIVANKEYRDIFYDAPLGEMYEEEALSLSSHPSSKSTSSSGSSTEVKGATTGYDTTNSYYASTSFPASIGWLWWFGRITGAQRLRIRGQIRGAHKRELKARYWSSPAWLSIVRDRVWEVLTEEGIDYLNGDDLEALQDFKYAPTRGESGSGSAVDNNELSADFRIDA